MEILIISLIISSIINMALLYQRKIFTEEILFHLENKELLSEAFTGYKKHLENIFELPMFYGDATLENLIEHTRAVSDLMGEYEDILEDNPPEVEDEAQPS